MFVHSIVKYKHQQCVLSLAVSQYLLVILHNKDICYTYGYQGQAYCVTFVINRRQAAIKIFLLNILCIIYTLILPQGIGFICHLSSYSFHILVMTFTVETLVDWPVFPSAVRIFVTATEGHTLWF